MDMIRGFFIALPLLVMGDWTLAQLQVHAGSPVSASLINSLENAINAKNSACGFAAHSFQIVHAGEPVHASIFNGLASATQELYVNLGLIYPGPNPSFAAAGSRISAAAFNQLETDVATAQGTSCPASCAGFNPSYSNPYLSLQSFWTTAPNQCNATTSSCLMSLGPGHGYGGVASGDFKVTITNTVTGHSAQISIQCNQNTDACNSGTTVSLDGVSCHGAYIGTYMFPGDCFHTLQNPNCAPYSATGRAACSCP
ncbi:MAG: hypothetical protein ACYCPQ_02715 [Elusimicrobiota bacterium]